MKNLFKVGDTKKYQTLVQLNDTASFDSGSVHPVYATFALGRDAEWCCRLFVLEMKDPDEEGIGTSLSIKHISPALPGSIVDFQAEIISLNKNEIICRYVARVGERIIAEGEQGQKILKKEKLEQLFHNISSANT